MGKGNIVFEKFQVPQNSGKVTDSFENRESSETRLTVLAVLVKVNRTFQSGAEKSFEHTVEKTSGL